MYLGDRLDAVVSTRSLSVLVSTSVSASANTLASFSRAVRPSGVRDDAPSTAGDCEAAASDAADALRVGDCDGVRSWKDCARDRTTSPLHIGHMRLRVTSHGVLCVLAEVLQNVTTIYSHAIGMELVTTR